jgi:hypothetical protein
MLHSARYIVLSAHKVHGTQCMMNKVRCIVLNGVRRIKSRLTQTNATAPEGANSKPIQTNLGGTYFIITNDISKFF